MPATSPLPVTTANVSARNPADHDPGTSLSVIIPAFNEANRLPVYLNRVIRYLTDSGRSHEIIVVDDGSSDQTAAVVSDLATEYPCLRLLQLEENRGKGFAVKTGMLAASGDLRLFADADGATPIEECERLQQAVRGGADIVIGSRALKSTDTAVQGRLHRKIMGTVFNGIVRSLALAGIRDSQCGFKLFRGAVAEELFSRQRIDGFGFDLEILFLAQCRGYTIAEIPVNWTDITGTKVRLFRDSVRMFLDVLRVRFNFMRGNYRAERALTRE